MFSVFRRAAVAGRGGLSRPLFGPDGAVLTPTVASGRVHSIVRVAQFASEDAQTHQRPRQKRRGRKVLKWTLGALLSGCVGYYGLKAIKRANRPSFPNEPKKKIVILGSGWGAMSVMSHLNPGQFDITVVSPRNYFLFSPILPSVTVGTVESRSIVEPVRKLILSHHGKEQVQFQEARCVDIDPDTKKVFCRDESGIVGEVSEFSLDYDILVVAVGATNNTFNTPGVHENCYFLKEMEDAHRIRNTMIDLFESSSIPGQPEQERKRLLHFVVVGGGPSGVEFASELRDFLREDVPSIYPTVLDDFKVTLVQSGDHILNNYDLQISKFTEEQFKKKESHVTTITRSRVVEVTPGEVVLKDKATREISKLPYGMCVWSTGVAPRPITRSFIEKLPQQKNARALVTDKFLRVRGAEGVFAVGDCSTVERDKMVAKAEELFKMADVNGDGTLTLEEFTALMEQAKQKYPQVQVLFSKAEHSVNKLFSEMDTSGDQRLDIQEFKELLRRLDRSMKSLPATAQVADQQGKYLGALLSNTNGNIVSQSTSELEKTLKPFEYRHLGSFAYVGNDRAVLEVPVFGALSGWWVMWLWRAAYASECASVRTKVLLVCDWIKSYIFGRDTSRI